MLGPQRRWVGLILFVGFGLGPVGALGASADSLGDVALLARCVPPDARLFIESRDLPGLLAAPGGTPLAELLAGWFMRPTTAPASTQPAGSQPARSFGLDRMVARAIGLDDAKAIDLLFSGRLALAADGWSGLGDAILLAEPKDPAALEAVLTSHRVGDSAETRVKRYRLGAGHELASDGRAAVVSRGGRGSGLYARTLELLGDEQAESLRDLAAFRERVSALRPESDLVFFGAGGGPAEEGGETEASMWWPAAWPELASVAVGVMVTEDRVVVETTGRLEAGVVDWRRSELPLDSLSRLPASAVAAWTLALPYAETFQRLDQAHFDGPVRFYLDFLKSGAGAGRLERDLLAHLVGDSVIILGQSAYRGSDSGADDPGLILPAIALAVETDEPRAVDEALGRLADNILGVLNLSTPGEEAFGIREDSIGAGAGVIRSIHLGRLHEASSRCAFLRALAVSWTVADRWLIVGSAPDLVRQIVVARRGEGATLPVGGAHEVVRQVQVAGGSVKMLLVAQPERAGAMIDSWLDYLSRHHPQTFEPDWWSKLRRRRLPAGDRVPLGILFTPGNAKQDGTIRVEWTRPGWPAHDRLLAGDVIVGIDGHPLDRADPAGSLRRHTTDRKRTSGITLRVLREGEPREIDIPIPAVETAVDAIQPLEQLRRFGELLRPFPSASYAVWQPAPDLLNARLELRFGATPAER